MYGKVPHRSRIVAASLVVFAMMMIGMAHGIALLGWLSLAASLAGLVIINLVAAKLYRALEGAGIRPDDVQKQPPGQ